MPDQKQCPQCGAQLTPAGSESVCAKCALGNALLSKEGQADSTSELTLEDAPSSPGFVDSDPNPGTMIGRYKLLQKIGVGGFGVVWMAEQREPVVRKVALKIIKLGMDTKQVVARFEAERQALALMDHSNIARVFDGGSTDTGRPYFVMELVRGVPITDYCDANKLSTKERLELFIDVCNAVQHAHQKGIIHRDIKPSNVMVTMHDDRAVVKVIDFGVAKATQQELTDKTLFTQYEQFIGTPAYMSPEQAQLSGLDIDTRSDVYALGVLLYELLTGTTPFGDREFYKAGIDEIRRKIREDDPPRPSTRLSSLGDKDLTDLAKRRLSEPRKLRSSLRGDLDWIVMKAIEKDRRRRYDAAVGLALDLTRHLNDEPVSAAAPRMSYALLKFARRNRTVFAAGSAVAIILVAATIFSVWMAGNAIREKGKALAASESETKANKKLEEQLRVSRHEQGKAWLERARLMQEQKRYLSARIMAMTALGSGLADTADGNDGIGNELLRPGSPEASQAERIISGEFDFPMLWSQKWRKEDAMLDGEYVSIVTCLDFSPDGKMMVTGGFDHTLRLWDTATGEQSGDELKGHKQAISCVAFSPDRLRIVSAGQDGTIIRDWNSGSRQEVTAFPFPTPYGKFNAIAFHPQGKKFATAGNDKFVRIWDSETGEEEKSLEGHKNLVYDIAYNPAGNILASVGRDSTIRLWDTGSGKEFKDRRIQHQGEPLRSVDFSPDGSLLAVGGDRGAYLYDLISNSQTPRTLQGHSEGVTSVDFSPDGILIASGGNDETIRIWDVATNTLHATLEGHSDVVMAVAFSPDGTVLGSCGKDNTVKLWQADRSLGRIVRSTKPVKVFPRTSVLNPTQKVAWSTSIVDTIEFGAAGNILAAMADKRTVGIFDATTGRQLKSFKHFWNVTAFKLNPDASQLAVACADHRVYLWDLEEERILQPPLAGHRDRITSIEFDPSGSLLATGGTERVVLLWDLNTYNFVRLQHPDSLRALQFDHTGKLLATGTKNRSVVFMRDVSNPHSVHKLSGHEGNVLGLAFHPKKTLLASASTDKTVKLWSLSSDTWKSQETILFSEIPNDVRFSPSGDILASADEGGQLRIFRSENEFKEDSTIMRGSPEPLRGISFHPDGKLIASYSSNGSVRIWPVDDTPWNSKILLQNAIEHCEIDGSKIDYYWPQKEMSKDSPVRQKDLRSSGTFWRFCAAENWVAARYLLEQMPLAQRFDAQLHLGRSLSAAGQRLIDRDPLDFYSEASRLLADAIKTSPELVDAWRARADFLHIQGKLDKALEELRRGIESVGEQDSSSGYRALFDLASLQYGIQVESRDIDAARDGLEFILSIPELPPGISLPEIASSYIDLHTDNGKRLEKSDSRKAEQILKTSAFAKIYAQSLLSKNDYPSAIEPLRVLAGMRKRKNNETMPELIGWKSQWQYWNQKEPPPPRWKAREFNSDGTDWTAGPAPLGFGDIGDATKLPFDGDIGDSLEAYYFRHSFDLPEPPEPKAKLIMQARRDDGLIVYLNGTKVFTDNMPEEVDGWPLALRNIEKQDERQILEFEVNTERLQLGKNVVAAEVHQFKLESSDIYFQLQAEFRDVSAGSYLAGMSKDTVEATLEDVENFLPPVLAAKWMEPMRAAFLASVLRDNNHSTRERQFRDLCARIRLANKGN